MRRRIYRIICVMMIAVVAAEAFGFFYLLFAQRVKEREKQVQMRASEIASYLNITDGKIDKNGFLDRVFGKDSELRVTVIDTSGNVIYDNEADAGIMENHGGRPEVEEAFATGRGESKRMSSTLDKSIYYAAVRLDNGEVVRVAESNTSIVWVAIAFVPELLLIILLICVAAVFIAKHMTKKIMKPINEIDINNIDNTEIYSEIRPFIERIKKDNEAREQTEQIRREFSANVSHELRTPLTTISGYAQMINNGMAKAEDVAFFGEKIEKEADRLILLINDIINLSKLDETDKVVSPEIIDLAEVARTVVTDLLPHAAKNGINIYFGGESVMVAANRTLLYEMIYNVVDNAIKYNRENGNVTVTTIPYEEGCAISVKDTGIGIAEEDRERIFERFYRVDKSHSKTIGGTGLGLSIVKHSAMIHRAQIKIESELGKWTEFTIVFPSIL